jgi:RecB family endonuclease NucS
MHVVLNAAYEAVDTEKNLEDAIEAEPGLLFRKRVKLLVRQHYIFSDAGERHFVDLVYADAKRKELILVELKRGQLTRDSVAQISRYLDHAAQSPLLAADLAKGWKLRGILASLEKSDLEPDRPDVTIRVVDRRKVIKVLGRLRSARQAAGRRARA